MIPAFADAVLGGGATALAGLTSAVGAAGTVVAGIALSRGTRWLTIRTVDRAASNHQPRKRFQELRFTIAQAPDLRAQTHSTSDQSDSPFAQLE